ncbi:cyclic nucleotide-binding domain-containing protein [Floridanema aerugineum]|uniref:Cyclic nucleotide-binding domain-containing protein n=1 Tax=Floridaenema aerugineum BLCC-F46 TaxID=3153654 RepID=A0ABV4XCR2_9CYAN
MSPVLTQLENLRVLQPPDLEWITQTGTYQEVSIGTVLIQEGQSSDSIYFILEGTVAILISQHNYDSDQEIARCGKGEVIGEMSFIDDRLPSATVKTVEYCQILALSKRKLQIKIERDPDFAARLYQEFAAILSSRLRNLSKLLAQSKIVPGQALRKVLFLFAILNDNDIDWMVTRGRKENAPAGTVLIQQDQPVEALYFLLQGNLAVIFSMIIDGKSVEKELARRASGEIVGEMSFVESGNASASIKCAENSLILAVSQELLREKFQSDRGFATRFYRAISLVLIDRLREGLVQRGFGQKAYSQDQELLDDIEYEDEIPLDVLEVTLLAGTRFKWMINRLQGN